MFIFDVRIACCQEKVLVQLCNIAAPEGNSLKMPKRRLSNHGVSRISPFNINPQKETQSKRQPKAESRKATPPPTTHHFHPPENVGGRGRSGPGSSGRSAWAIRVCGRRRIFLPKLREAVSRGPKSIRRAKSTPWNQTDPQSSP